MSGENQCFPFWGRHYHDYTDLKSLKFWRVHITEYSILQRQYESIVLSLLFMNSDSEHRQNPCAKLELIMLITLYPNQKYMKMDVGFSLFTKM